MLKERGSRDARAGSSSMNEECGLLVDGYDKEPVMMMPYNPPYYETLFAAHGPSR